MIVTVHNHIDRTQRTRNGVNGFRVWKTELSDRLEVCPCIWHGEDGTHYRIQGKQAAGYPRCPVKT